ncbi:MAG: SGNH/GDSL hydrolase family protein [Paracoccus sp. (in: a-proteobacteria)]|nr:SGNH/GDSL hydrolase family protein [Paracoccus sp. (in: a-proteobacteria)]
MTGTIMAFGDSLTWGMDPRDGTRHAYADRWPSVLEAGLGAGHRVIAEGLNGRTTAFDDPAAPCERNGAKTLPMLLASHAPLDLVIIMLGTNDLKAYISPTIDGPVAGMARLIQIVRHFPYSPPGAVPQILVLAPPHCAAPDSGADPAGGRNLAETRKFGARYAALAREQGCAFLDAAGVAQPSGVDGVHLDAANTRAIGTALIAPVRAILAASG